MRLTKKARAAAFAIGLLPLTLAAPAGAQLHLKRQWSGGGSTINFRAYTDNLPGNLEYWERLRTWQAMPGWNTVCNYVSSLDEYHPIYGMIFTQVSSYHAGCTFLMGWFDWPNWTANYVEDTRMRGWWWSDSTVAPYFQEIGYLQD